MEEVKVIGRTTEECQHCKGQGKRYSIKYKDMYLGECAQCNGTGFFTTFTVQGKHTVKEIIIKESNDEIGKV